MNFNAFKRKYEKVPVLHYQHSVTEKPLVSVCVQTYQHAPYIKECLDGILMQQTDFDFEILIGEDASMDGTRELCIEFANRYPDKIRLFLHQRENNISMDGHATGRFNFMYNFYSAKGKYIALCEGDDYWTDPLKIQKQVDFLETSEDFVLVYHPSGVLERNGKLNKDYIADRIKTPDETNKYDLVTFGNYIHTPSVVFRNCIKDFPPAFLRAPIADFFLYVLLTQKGMIKRLPDEMAVYRNHVGVYSTKLALQKRIAWIKTTGALLESIEDATLQKILTMRIGKDSESIKNSARVNLNTLAKNISISAWFGIMRFKIENALKRFVLNTNNNSAT